MADSRESRGAKRPVLALGLAFAFPGLGQLYNGQIVKGLVLLALPMGVLVCVAAVAAVVAGDLATAALYTVASALLALVASWTYGMVDAYRTARRGGSRREDD